MATVLRLDEIKRLVDIPQLILEYMDLVHTYPDLKYYKCTFIEKGICKGEGTYLIEECSYCSVPHFADECKIGLDDDGEIEYYCSDCVHWLEPLYGLLKKAQEY